MSKHRAASHSIAPAQNTIAIGRVLRAKGIRGEVVILPLTEYVDRFHIGEYLRYWDRDGEEQRLKIDRCRTEKNTVVIGFSTIYDRTAAEKLKSIIFTISPDEVRDLPDNEYYIFQLIGLSVFNDSQNPRGKVVDIITDGPHDYFVVQWEEHQYLIPMVSYFIRCIDLDAKRVEIREVDGMWIPYL